MLISIHLKNAWTRSEQRVDVTASYEVGFIPKAYAHARLSGLSDRQIEEVAESLSLEGLEAALRELYIHSYSQEAMVGTYRKSGPRQTISFSDSGYS